MMKFKYKMRDAAAIDKRASQSGSDFKGIFKDEYRTWRPAAGDNFIRILPPTWPDAEHYGLDVHVHFNVGPDRASILCLNKMKKKKCPLCEAAQKAERSGDEELSKELRARHQVAVWMVDMREKEKGPMIWSMSWTIDRDIAKQCRDKQTGEIYPIDHPEEGYNISFDRQGTGLTTKYGGYQLGKRATSIQQDWLDWAVNEPLPETLVWLTYDEIQEIFEGGADAEDDDEEKKPSTKAASKRQAEPDDDAEDDEPAPRKPAKAAVRPSDEKADDDEDAEEEAEEEVKTKVKFKPKGKPAAKAEPEEDADEEEEGAPSPKKKAAAKADDEDAPVSGQSRADALRARFGKK